MQPMDSHQNFFFFFEDIIFLGSQKKGTIAYCLKNKVGGPFTVYFLGLHPMAQGLHFVSVECIEINITSAFSKIKVTWTPLSQAEL